MRITGLSALFIVIFLLSSCSYGVGQDVTPPSSQSQTRNDGPPVRAVPVAKVESETVISPALCAQARQRDATAQNIIATYYDSVIDATDIVFDEDGTPNRSAKAMVAAMYWYDLAIHYDQANEAAKARRRILGGAATPDIMEMFRNFTKRWNNPPCMPQDVFEGDWS